MLKAAAKLGHAGLPVYPWREPDLDNQLTAVAVGPVSGEARRHLRRYQLLKEKS